jgi:peptidoglycan/LPS O-acetylase OafA/YrhL
VLSRWLAPWVRRSAGLVLLVTGLAQASVALVRSCSVAALDACTPDHAVARLAVNSQLLSYCFWFALGLAASFHMPAFKATLRRLRPVLPWLLVALFVAAAGEWEVVRRLSGRTWVPSGVGIGDNLFELALLLTYLAHDDGPLPWAAPLERVGVMSYGIYLVHMPVLEVAARVLYHLSPFLLAYQVVLMAAVSAVGVGAPMLLMRFAKSSPLRRYYAYAFG